jgi:hypothetical protein
MQSTRSNTNTASLIVVLLGALVAFASTADCGHAATLRSSSAKAAFKRDHPCPVTGARSGPCGGYVIDHIVPLACGGADAPGNMQWQTIAEAKAKDRWERDGCHKGERK